MNAENVENFESNNTSLSSVFFLLSVLGLNAFCAVYVIVCSIFKRIFIERRKGRAVISSGAHAFAVSILNMTCLKQRTHIFKTLQCFIVVPSIIIKQYNSCCLKLFISHQPLLRIPTDPLLHLLGNTPYHNQYTTSNGKDSVFK